MYCSVLVLYLFMLYCILGFYSVCVAFSRDGCIITTVVGYRCTVVISAMGRKREKIASCRHVGIVILFAASGERESHQM